MEIKRGRTTITLNNEERELLNKACVVLRELEDTMNKEHGSFLMNKEECITDTFQLTQAREIIADMLKAKEEMELAY